MAKAREYKCCICHKQLENKETIRLAKQLYGISYSGGHYTVDKYDFCKDCYKIFARWLRKHSDNNECKREDTRSN